MVEEKSRAPAETGSDGTGVPAAGPEERWDPLASFRHEIDRLFEDFDFGPFGRARPMRASRRSGSPERIRNWVLVPAMDMTETEAGYRLTAELPGLEADDVQITVANGTLTISGEKKAETDDKKPGYVMSERRYGAFRRGFRLPEDVDPDTISADFSKGVLTLTLPRTERARSEQRRIEVTSR